jgi:hypothetical protein
MASWYSLCSFGMFFPVLDVWAKKNLATLLWKRVKNHFLSDVEFMN